MSGVKAIYDIVSSINKLDERCCFLQNFQNETLVEMTNKYLPERKVNNGLSKQRILENLGLRWYKYELAEIGHIFTREYDKYLDEHETDDEFKENLLKLVNTHTLHY